MFEHVRAEHVGSLPTSYWLFSPERSSPANALPVAVFLHGFGSVDPNRFRARIDHIVRRGAVLIYPDYQTEDLTRTSSSDYQSMAIAGHAGPVNLDSIAIVGHSLGAMLAHNTSWYCTVIAAGNRC